jgi:ankyrin repeat protein
MLIICSTLHVSFKNLEEEAANPMSILNRRGVGRKADMDTILSNIKPVLEDLERMVSKYSSLGKTEKRKWDRLRFGAEDLDNIRGKLTFHTSVIDLFMNNLSAGSLAKIETALEEIIIEIRAGRRAKTVLSVQDEGTESATAWKELETDLLDSGITKKDIEKHKDAIRSYIKTLMVEETEDSSLSARGSGSLSIANFVEGGQDPIDNENWDSISQRGSLEKDHEQESLSTTIAASPLAGADATEIQDATSPKSPTEIVDLVAAKDSMTVAPSLLHQSAQSLQSSRNLWSRPLDSPRLSRLRKPSESGVASQEGSEPSNASKRSLSQGVASEPLLEPKPKVSSIQRPLSSSGKPRPSYGSQTYLPQNPLPTYIRSRSEGSRHLDIVERMLEKVTDDKAKDHDGQMALRVAANNGHKAVVKLPPKESDGDATERSPSYLVRYEASDKDHDQDEKTTKAGIGKGEATEVELTSKIAVVEASRVGLRGRVLEDEDDVATIFPLLSNTLQVPNPNRSSDGAEQSSPTLPHLDAVPSHIAQNEMAAQLLLQNGFDVKQKDLDKEKALCWAATSGHKAVVKLLLEKGADIEAKVKGGGAALHCATLEGHEAVVRLLLEKGADIEAKTNDGWTAMYRAAFCGHEVVARLLLEKGADIEAKTNDGWTAMHRAAKEGHEAVVRLLLEKGVDIRAKDRDGRTALHFAAKEGHDTIVKLLKQTQPSLFQLLKLSVRRGRGG